MKFDIKKYAIDAVVPAGAILAAAPVELKLETYFNSTGNTGIFNALSSNAAVNKGGATSAKNAKLMKVALYTAAGLGIQALAEAFGDGEEMIDVASKAAGYFTYSLASNTYSEDPYIPSPVYTPATVRQPAMKTYRNPVGSVIS